MVAGAVPRTACAQDRELIIISYGGQLQEPHRWLADRMEKRHPGLKIRLVPSESQDIVAQIKAAQGHSPYDAMPNDEPPHLIGIREGYITKRGDAALKNLAAVYPALIEKSQGYGVPATYSLVGIAYNTALVKTPPESWADLWKPEVKGKLASPDFDPSHLIVVSAMLSGGDAVSWERGQDKLKALKPNFKAFYTNDANSQQLIASGETPVQVILSMNAHYMKGQGVPVEIVIPKEGAVLGIDTIAIFKGSKKTDLAYKFINIMLDPAIQSEAAKLKKASPVVTNAKLDPEVAKLPGVFTTPEQWKTQAIIVDHKMRGEKTPEWRKWFAENIMN